MFWSPKIPTPYELDETRPSPRYLSNDGGWRRQYRKIHIWLVTIDAERIKINIIKRWITNDAYLGQFSE